jgi:drug/metabolite transporter (DMT)-like permease
VAAPCFAATAKILAKRLTSTESPVTITAYLALLMTPITLIPALFVWRTPGWEELGVLCLAGVFGSIGHLSFVRAYAIVDISLVEPVVFTRMVWAALIGYLAFAELPDIWTWAGAAMIVGASTIIAHRERGSRADAGAG